MKTINKITVRVFGAVSVLFTMAAISYAALPTCNLGTVTATGSGFQYETGSQTLASGSRSVTLTCDTNIGFGVDTERTFIVPPTPDKDGIYAAALTALADGKKVKYQLSTIDLPGAGTTKGQIRLLHVTNVDLL